MKTPLMAALVAALSLAAHSANAQDYAGQRYLGISIGQTKSDLVDCDFDPTVTWTNCPAKDTGIKLYVGHNLHKNFAVEAGFIDFGKLKSNYAFDDNGRLNRGLVKTSGNSLFVAGMGKIQVHPKATLFGKVGLHRWEGDIDIEPGHRYDTLTSDDDGVDLLYGIGGTFAPFSNEKIKLRMEYEMFTVEHFFNFDDTENIETTRDSVDIDFEFISIGIVYAF